jgi:MoxR-like ATPase
MDDELQQPNTEETVTANVEAAEEAPAEAAAVEEPAAPAPEPEPVAEPAPADGKAVVEQIRGARDRITAELSKAIVGQEEVVEQIIIAMFSRGHCLMTGVPGLGKTLLVKSIAEIFSLSFKRVQFTPDLMPADIYGTEVVEEDAVTGKRLFSFVKGPVFANIVLADEINRTPPKTQAALLEAMEERQVTAAGQTHELDKPFFVLATQNPIELEGTYPLPEAQLDRFLFNVVLEYLPTELEEQMVLRTTDPSKPELQEIFTGPEIEQIQQLVREVPVSSNVVRYAVRLVSATRKTDAAPDYVREMVKWGAGSRASQALILAGKARALLHGRYNVAIEDVKALAVPVLRHRVVTNFHADAEGITTDDIIRRLLNDIPE